MMTAIEAEQDRRHAERHPKSAALVARFAEEQYLADRQALFADDGAELVVHDPR